MSLIFLRRILEKYVDTYAAATSKKYSDYSPTKQKTSIFGNIEAYQVELSFNCHLYYLYAPNKNGIIVISRANLSYSTNPYWTI